MLWPAQLANRRPLWYAVDTQPTCVRIIRPCTCCTLATPQTSTKTRKVPDKGGRHPTGPPASTKAIDSAARFRPLPDRALELQSTVHFQSLATETKLQLQQLLTFERQGFCITRGLLSQDCMLELQQAVAASLDQKRLAALKQRYRLHSRSM